MKVRPATVADLVQMVPIHANAFKGQIGPAVGPGYLKAFLRWFIDEPDAVSLIAEADGCIQGYVFGAADGYGPKLTRQLLPVIGLGVLSHLPQVVSHPSFRRQLRSRAANLLLGRDPRSAIAKGTPAGTFCLVGLGTSAEARGKGVGTALVRALCERSGGRSVALDVFKDNMPARALYERCGFSVLVEEGRVLRMIRPP